MPVTRQFLVSCQSVGSCTANWMNPKRMIWKLASGHSICSKQVIRYVPWPVEKWTGVASILMERDNPIWKDWLLPYSVFLKALYLYNNASVWYLQSRICRTNWQKFGNLAFPGAECESHHGVSDRITIILYDISVPTKWKQEKQEQFLDNYV